MRIVFITPIGHVGGAERVLLNSLQQLKSLRPEWHLHVVLCGNGPLDLAVQQLGISTTVCPLPTQFQKVGDSQASVLQLLSRFLRVVVSLWSLPVFLWKLRSIVARQRPNLVYSNGLKTHLFSALIKKRSWKLFWHAHDFYGSRRLAKQLLGYAAARVDRVIAISRAVASDFSMVNRKPHVIVVHNGVDVDRFFPRLDQETSSIFGHRTEREPLKVGLIATYAKWKGHEQFIKALASIPEVIGYIVGGPIYETDGSQWTRKELEDIAQRFGVHDRIAFVEFQSDTAAVYRNLDIIVHASTKPEPFGLTIAEAMASGCATVVSKSGGAIELFEDGNEALGFETNNLESLVDAIRRLTDNTELRVALGVAARRRMVNDFSLQMFGSKLVTAIEEVSRTERS